MNPIPTKEQILQWIADHPTLTAKRDIAKAFGVKDAGRIELLQVRRHLGSEFHDGGGSLVWRPCQEHRGRS